MSKTMPSRTDKSAPSFSGNPKDLEDYLEDVVRVCQDCGKNDEKDFVEAALHYLSADDREAWKTLPQSKASPLKWPAFKDAVMAIYPGSQTKGRYELTDLENLVADRSHKAPRDLATLANIRELSRLYVKGLGANLREIVGRRLEIRHPDHSLLRPHDLADIVKEAEFCLSGTSTYTTSSANKDKASTVKIEGLDPGAFASAIVTAFTTAGLAAQPMMNNAVQQRYAAPMQYAPPQQMPQQQQRQAFVQQPIQPSQQPVMPLRPPRRPRECYCGGTCQTWRACRVHQEDMANGTLAVDSNGRSMLRNGSRTWPRGPGTLHDRVLQWNRENPDARLPSGQTFLLETIPSRKDYSRIPLSASIVPATAFESVIAEQQANSYWDANIAAAYNATGGRLGPPMPPGKHVIAGRGQRNASHGYNLHTRQPANNVPVEQEAPAGPTPTSSDPPPPPKSPVPPVPPKAPEIVSEAHVEDPFAHIEDVFDAGDDSDEDATIAAALRSSPKQAVQEPARAVVEPDLVPPVPTFKSRNPLRQDKPPV
ncbi:hypothetical protein BDZ89DRAFT_1148974 [Hymenopellis radicata]|nr:hypothetical protein BDZ89DRAFT_1148974 [Hymenopellis radicata]